MSWHLAIVLFQLHLSLQVVGCREFVIGHLLGEIVDYLAVGIIGQVHYPIIVDLRVPEIVWFREGFEYAKGGIGVAQLWDEGPIRAVAHVDSSFLSGWASNQRFGSFEGVNMVLEGSHYFILIEVGNPVEEGE